MEKDIYIDSYIDIGNFFFAVHCGGYYFSKQWWLQRIISGM